VPIIDTPRRAAAGVKNDFAPSGVPTARALAVRRAKALALTITIMLAMSMMPVLDIATASAAGIAGMSVFLDPGHSGVNDSSITRQVPNGRGGMKDCQTTGTSTNDGYPEHAFNWDVAVRVRAALNQSGVRTQMSRPDDDSLAPCIDQRAAAANAIHPDAIVSIHADGGPASGHGFHVNYSAPPLNDVQSGPSVQLATVMRDAMAAAGMQPSTYIGSSGLYGRADLAGLNLAESPAVLVEVGNMRNGDDAAQMEIPDGRQRYADAVTRGIVAYLTQKAGTA
jgi:N-acetylmuramoyl-L-alanine amidase